MSARNIFTCLVPLLLLVLSTGCAMKGQYRSEERLHAGEIYDRAQHTYERKKYDEAAEHYDRVITEYPDSPLAEVSMYYAAECHRQKDDLQAASFAYKRLINKHGTGFWAERARQRLEEIEAGR